MTEKANFEKTLVFYGDRCTGCNICELICSMDKHGEYNPKKSFIRILRNWEMDVNIAVLDLNCDFCNQCVTWCPTDAIRFFSQKEAAILRKKNQIGVFPAPLMGSG